MKDLGYMTFAAAEQYKRLFDEQGIACEIKDFNLFLRILFGGGWGNNKRVNILVADEQYEEAKKIFDQQEIQHAKRVAELTPAANRMMMTIGASALAGVFLFYYMWQHIK